MSQLRLHVQHQAPAGLTEAEYIRRNAPELHMRMLGAGSAGHASRSSRAADPGKQCDPHAPASALAMVDPKKLQSAKESHRAKNAQKYGDLLADTLAGKHPSNIRIYKFIHKCGFERMLEHSRKLQLVYLCDEGTIDPKFKAKFEKSPPTDSERVAGYRMRKALEKSWVGKAQGLAQRSDSGPQRFRVTCEMLARDNGRATARNLVEEYRSNKSRVDEYLLSGSKSESGFKWLDDALIKMSFDVADANEKTSGGLSYSDKFNADMRKEFLEGLQEGLEQVRPQAASSQRKALNNAGKEGTPWILAPNGMADVPFVSRGPLLGLHFAKLCTREAEKLAPEKKMLARAYVLNRGAAGVSQFPWLQRQLIALDEAARLRVGVEGRQQARKAFADCLFPV